MRIKPVLYASFHADVTCITLLFHPFMTSFLISLWHQFWTGYDISFEPLMTLFSVIYDIGSIRVQLFTPVCLIIIPVCLFILDKSAGGYSDYFETILTITLFLINEIQIFFLLCTILNKSFNLIIILLFYDNWFNF